MNDRYDIIGDIHGYARTLESLLEQLGYRKSNGIFRHHARTAIFLGDFVDRGPAQRGVLDIVRPMIESGAALSVMGNHEFNAIAYYTSDESGGFLREHSKKTSSNIKRFSTRTQIQTTTRRRSIGLRPCRSGSISAVSGSFMPAGTSA